MENRIRLAVIYGSHREDRLCDTIADWVKEELALCSEYFDLDVIDPNQLDLPNKVEKNDAVQAYAQRIGHADAFIVITPEYNHSFPAAIMHLIDLVHYGWAAKPVAFVSYGGVSGGLRAVAQLRLVFAELHAVSIRDTVSYTNAWQQIDKQGHLISTRHTENAMKKMLNRLYWWSSVLRQGKLQTQYNSEVITP